MTRPPRAVRALLIILLAIVTGLAVTPVASAATVRTTPDRSWSLNGRVYASVVIGGTLYLGGDFTSATSPTGVVVAKARLAAFNISTGELIAGFSANANQSVRALATDGGAVYAGGAFTSIRGSSRNRIAKLNPTTGAPSTTFKPSVTGGSVLAVDVRGGRVFAGGSFTAVGGVARSRVAALDAASGKLDSAFAPTSNGSVNAVRVTSDGSKAYLGGSFTSIAGSARTGLAQVSTGTGRPTPLVFANSPAIVLALDLLADGSRVLVAGGGSNNSGAAWSTSSGRRVWSIRTDGDVQAIHYFDGDAYLGFHDGFNGVTTTKLLKVTAATGVIDKGFTPVYDGFWGNFTITHSGSYLITGGQYTRVGGVVAGNWARFPVSR